MKITLTEKFNYSYLELTASKCIYLKIHREKIKFNVNIY